MNELEHGQATTPLLSASIGNLQQFLSKLQVEEVKQPFTMERFKLGQSNPTFLITGADGKQWVLRKKPPGKIISPTAHRVDREYQVLKAVMKHLPVPRPLLYCPDVEVLGTPFYVPLPFSHPA